MLVEERSDLGFFIDCTSGLDCQTTLLLALLACVADAFHSSNIVKSCIRMH